MELSALLPSVGLRVGSRRTGRRFTRLGPRGPRARLPSLYTMCWSVSSNSVKKRGRTRDRYLEKWYEARANGRWRAPRSDPPATSGRRNARREMPGAGSPKGEAPPRAGRGASGFFVRSRAAAVRPAGCVVLATRPCRLGTQPPWGGGCPPGAPPERWQAKAPRRTAVAQLTLRSLGSYTPNGEVAGVWLPARCDAWRTRPRQLFSQTVQTEARFAGGTSSGARAGATGAAAVCMPRRCAALSRRTEIPPARR